MRMKNENQVPVGQKDEKVNHPLAEQSVIGSNGIMFSIFFAFLCKGMMVALMAPFFPLEVSIIILLFLYISSHYHSQAENKGLSATQYGFVIGAFTFGQVIFTPASGHLVTIMTPKVACVSGMMIMACSTITFSFVILVPDGWIFFVIASCLRLVSAVGSCLMSTAAFTQIFLSFPDRIPICVVSYSINLSSC